MVVEDGDTNSFVVFFVSSFPEIPESITGTIMLDDTSLLPFSSSSCLTTIFCSLSSLDVLGDDNIVGSDFDRGGSSSLSSSLT